ncbi:hypothetical protein OG439_31985 [Amycolatopsis sp. NBC_01307]|uniref:hypothetical protein n=1 Tax=Amycolatopsis sp. NBC_01307 TaxID=2903561 RepID=UPI002E131AB0|nr:hypothetical protein OG439_31985 [Amycolatopsis sp. NBC_01307]
MIEVTSAEESAALKWLAKRGQPVGRPTPLLTALIATRRSLYSRGLPRYFAIVVGICVIGSGYSLLFGPGATRSDVAYFIYFGIQLSMWDGIRWHERKLGASVPSRSPAEPWWQALGGWYLVSVVAAFGGGIALAVTMYFTTAARTYAVSWLGLLALSALCCGWILTGVLRGRDFGETPESLAVHRALRIERLYLAMPGFVVFPVILELLWPSRRPPAEVTPWLAGYIAVVVVLQLISGILHWRRQRRLPPGDYGRPLPTASSPARTGPDATGSR